MGLFFLKQPYTDGSLICIYKIRGPSELDVIFFFLVCFLFVCGLSRKVDIFHQAGEFIYNSYSC